LPGILLEDHVNTAAVEPEVPPELAAEDRIRRAARDADIGPNIILDDVEDDRSGLCIQNNNAFQQNNAYQNNFVYNMNNNIVQPDEGDIELQEAAGDGEDEIPALGQYEDSSDEEDEEEEEPEGPAPVEDEELDDRSAADEPTVTRSGRTVKKPSYYRDEYQFLQSTGRWRDADNVEKRIASEEKKAGFVGAVGEEPIELMEGLRRTSPAHS
jgi:hypothetical protein